MNTPTIPSNIFKLLADLKTNNNREWYQENKDSFVGLENDFKTFGTHVAERLEEFDNINRAKLYRLYRDIRFSKDKTPFHTHRGYSFFRKGKGEYYMHIESGNSYAIVGYWDITKEDLTNLRQEFAFDTTEIKNILSDAQFKKYFSGLLPFEVKTAPRGFDKDHENIEFIRKKSLLVKHSFTDEEVLSDQFSDKIMEVYKTGYPFLQYINDVLNTDENGEPL